jgi:phosphoglycerol transferase MdoB-like AlkP superfamily enzyme
MTFGLAAGSAYTTGTRSVRGPEAVNTGFLPMQREEHIVSHIDLASTLLSLTGISSVLPMPGADLTVSQPNRAIMQ